MKLIDLTQDLVSASARSDSWTESKFLEVRSEVIETVRGSYSDWDPEAGEEWGRVLVERKTMFMLRINFPFCFADKSFQVILQPILEKYAVVTVYVSDWDGPDFQVDPQMANTLFGRDLVFYGIDLSHLSVNDLWWATVV
jgi:hypothetical protein